MRKKILVISHERSGTHFLINTIAQCFDYLPQQIDLDNSQGIDWSNPAMTSNWMRQFQGRFVANIFKSHHACPILAPLLPELIDEYTIFYIQRDGRDVMTSFWIYLNRLAPGWGPRTRTVGEFMRATAAGGITQYQTSQHEITMLQRWVEHVEGWNLLDIPIHYVSYEDLHTSYDDMLERIAGILEQQVVSSVRPTLESPSSLPWKGTIGAWKELFTEEDRWYFEQNTKQIQSRT
ncbi:sulfotransferase domain-containing protein [Gammaproteobacteria bacterium]|nr:sulfotransferase domain-containing protein [Gammaproteobacteria bacterium]